MRKILLYAGALSLGLASYLPVKAVIADPTPRLVKQPDGTEVTLLLHGDEFFNYTTTTDENTVVFNSVSGLWEYASLGPDGNLLPTGERAADGVTPRRATRQLKPMVTPARRQADNNLRLHALGPKYDYSKFRGLVILVEFNDAPFSREDIHEVFTDMVNKHDYDGYMSNNLLPTKVPYPGSVRDYYYENSNGMFDPEFDVVGPVRIDFSQYYARQSTGAQSLVTAALRAADDMVDYSVYDTDGNRQVDMVYFIFSGAGSNFSGNDPNLLWPHASTVMSLSLDGVSFGRYACSTELYGPPANKQLDGIGTICHEFSHVLGLPDLYDVDYATGGQSIHPQKWSLMASGSYLNMSRTPCGYSLYERYALGFATPRVIMEPGTYTINPLNEGTVPDGCRIDTPIPDEFFLLESRVRTRWDEYLPGEGLLVHRVDSTDASVWQNNKINAVSTHNYYTLLRAMPSVSESGTVTDSDGDPFPGSGEVTSITNATDPSMRSWTTTSSPLVIQNIQTDDAGRVTFEVITDDVPTLLEDFLTMPLTASDTTEVKGRFSNWDFSGGARVSGDDFGLNYVATVKGANLVCQPFDGTAETCSVTIENPTSQNAIFRLYYSTDGGAIWRTLSTIEGTSNPSVAKGSTTTVHYGLGALDGVSFKLTQFSGNATSECRVRKIEFGIKAGSFSEIQGIATDANAAPVEWYNIQGVRVAEKNLAPGIYIRRQGSNAVKLVIN